MATPDIHPDTLDGNLILARHLAEREDLSVHRDGDGLYVLSNHKERILMRYSFADLLYYFLGEDAANV